MKTLEEFRNYIDSHGYANQVWIKIIEWQHEQVDLLRQGKRRDRGTEKLVDVYYDEVYSKS